MRVNPTLCPTGEMRAAGSGEERLNYQLPKKARFAAGIMLLIGLSIVGMWPALPAAAACAPVPTALANLSNFAPNQAASPTECPTASTTAMPTTALPTTAVPTTAVPTTAVPTTAVPTTAVPTTAVPTTAVPTTAVPTTAVPTTAVPTTTAIASATSGSQGGSSAASGAGAPRVGNAGPDDFARMDLHLYLAAGVLTLISAALAGCYLAMRRIEQ